MSRSATSQSRTAVEPEVRRVVADVLGVGAADLAPAVSLVEDLAADSLDLVEIGLALEAALGVSMPDHVLERIRTYGDLLSAVRRAPVERGAFVRARFALPETDGRGLVERSGWLTPYLTETIAEDARHAVPGTRLDVRVISSAANGIVAVLERTLERVRARGLAVSLRSRPDGQTEAVDRADETAKRTCTM